VRSFYRFLPDWAVDILVERWAARGELAQGIVLRAHERRAVAECSTNALAVKRTVLLQLFDQVWLRERCPAEADESRSPVGHVRTAGVRQEFLKIAVPAADERQIGEFRLNFGREAKMPVHADERMLRRLVAVRRWRLERPNQVRRRVGIAERDIDQRD